MEITDELLEELYVITSDLNAVYNAMDILRGAVSYSYDYIDEGDKKAIMGLLSSWQAKLHRRYREIRGDD